MATKAECPSISEGLNFIPAFLLWELAKKRKATITVNPFYKRLGYQYTNEVEKELEANEYLLINHNLNQKVPLRYFWFYADAIVKGHFPYSSTFNSAIPRELSDGQKITIRTTSSAPEYFDDIQTTISSIYGLRFLSKITPIPTNCGLGQYETRSLHYIRNNGNIISCLTSASSDTGVGIYPMPFNIRLVEDVGTTPINCTANKISCTFDALNCGIKIHSENRASCPRIEPPMVTYDLKKSKVITIDLNPFDILYISRGSGGILGTFWANFLNLLSLTLANIPFANSLLQILDQLILNNPSECVLITVLRNLSSVETIAQICSSCTSPYPDTNIQCFSEEDCPFDTCKVDCDTHYCCYNSQGISVLSIPK
jgi:hypothetical protein